MKKSPAFHFQWNVQMSELFKIRWLGTACFEIRLAEGTTLVIDPYLDESVSAPITSDEIEGGDFIFLTHGHYDHVLDVGILWKRFNSKIYCSREVSRNLQQNQHIPQDFFREVTAGDRVSEKNFSAEIIQGVHVDFFAEYRRLTGEDFLPCPEADLKATIQKVTESLMGPVIIPDQFETWMAQYPGGEQLNFVFDPGEGQRIYMAGSYPDPGLMEVARKTKASLMLLQVLPGKTLRGLEEQTARFALSSGAKTVVPQHHDPLFKGGERADLGEIRKILECHGVNLTEFSPGVWYEF
jgi:L-ascorbate metabolism protein UlaG (beta-lactamase superfamily)